MPLTRPKNDMQNRKTVADTSFSMDCVGRSAHVQVERPINIVVLCVIFIFSLLLSSFGHADERPKKKSLWVATRVDLRAQFFGVPISQKTTTPEMTIYFANNGTAYITLYGSKDTSKGLVLPPNNALTETRNQADYVS